MYRPFYTKCDYACTKYDSNPRHSIASLFEAPAQPQSLSRSDQVFVFRHGRASDA